MDPELAAVAALADAEYDRAEARLRDLGWLPAGEGDWARVLASPSRRWAARISPFDPAARYTAELYRRAALTRLVPRLGLHRELPGGATLTALEHLDPLPPAEAAALHRALAEGAPETAELAAHLQAVHAIARAELPWCGPIDDNPRNAMRTADGRSVLTDPYYADGPALYAAAGHDPVLVARAIPAERRRHMTEIPLAESGPWPRAERERMRRALDAASARLG